MDKILDYWNKEDVQSMYDKYLIEKEISLISSLIPQNSQILDAGCGEGEGTIKYSGAEGTTVLAIDFSKTRLNKAKERMKLCDNVKFKIVDLKSEFDLGCTFDCIITQRTIINLPNWELQKRALENLSKHLRPGGLMIICEGSIQGNEKLNSFRNLMQLPPINIRWHNAFICDEKLQEFFLSKSFKLIKSVGLGSYYFLTRGIRPVFDEKLNWDSPFNQMAKDLELCNLIPNINDFSKLKVWAFQKQ